jgi:hypothetical protein
VSGGVYSNAQLQQLWIQAGGDPKVAPTAAAIAQAESGGHPGVVNGIGATGLWQIYGNPFPGNAKDPLTNAKMAVAKYKGAGNKFTPWTTYTGADTGPGGTPGPKTYLRYLKPGTSSSTSPAPSAAPADATQGSDLFADKASGLKYATVWLAIVLGGLAVTGIGINRSLGGAPARATKTAGKAAALA